MGYMWQYVSTQRAAQDASSWPTPPSDQDKLDDTKDDDPNELTDQEKREKAERTFKNRCMPAVKSENIDRIIRECKKVLEYDPKYYQALIQIANAMHTIERTTRGQLSNITKRRTGLPPSR